MRPGDVVLIRLPQFAGGPLKLRPALMLALLPGPYQNVFICGISTQLEELQADWDELIAPQDSDFVGSGLHRASAIRLSYLYSAHTREFAGVIGRIDSERLRRILTRLVAALSPTPLTA